MDSVPCQVTFSYDRLSRSRSSLSQPWEICLGIDASFRVDVAGENIYSEELFPVVEFAVDAEIWSATAQQTQQDFAYTSMDAEQKGLIWVKRVEGGWQLGSALREKGASKPVDLLEIQAALDAFYFRLREDVKTIFGVDINVLFDWQRAKGARQLSVAHGWRGNT